MNRLVIIAIGGSGERVMNSFIMSLAAGVPVNATSVLPIIIDNDQKSFSLSRCKDLIKYYRKKGTARDSKMGAFSIYEKAWDDPVKWPSFFKTPIEEPIFLDSDGANIGDLNTVIGALNNQTQRDILEERDLLFTDKDLTMELDGGFIGNPNIGSVVLNAIALHDNRYTAQQNAIGAGDGVVVVGSLFGGTGAAGIPLIVNKFKEKAESQQPYIGVVSLLPYFTTNNSSKAQIRIDEHEDVISDMFDVKARAALMYYDDYMQGVDAQYYVGDGLCKAVYPHNTYGDLQRNDSHPIEVMAALSLVDFAKGDFKNRVVYKRPVWSFKNENDDGNVALTSNLTDISNADFKKALVKFQMLKWILSEDDFLKDDIVENRKYVHDIGFDEDMRVATFTKDEHAMSQYPYAWGLNQLFKEWDMWLNELSNYGEIPSKRKMIYIKKDTVTEEKFTRLFFTDQMKGWGIAKVIQVRDGLFGRRDEPVDPQLKNALMKSYNDLVKSQTIDVNGTVSDEKKLPYLLLIISNALDSVLADKCTL